MNGSSFIGKGQYKYSRLETNEEFNECDGGGSCFTRIKLGPYTKKYNCIHKCKLIKCPNFDICQHERPQHILNIHSGRCFDCNIHWGINLEKKIVNLSSSVDLDNPSECQLCMRTYPYLYKQPQCEHCLCAICLRKIHFDITVNPKDLPLIIRKYDFIIRVQEAGLLEHPLLMNTMMKNIPHMSAQLREIFSRESIEVYKKNIYIYRAKVDDYISNLDRLYRNDNCPFCDELVPTPPWKLKYN